jgi:hypothetical protein
VKIDQHALPDRRVAESNVGTEARAAVTDDQHVIRIIMTSVPNGRPPLYDLGDRPADGNETPVESGGVPG